MIVKVAIPSHRVNVSYSWEEIEDIKKLISPVAIPSHRVNVSYLLPSNVGAM